MSHRILLRAVRTTAALYRRPALSRPLSTAPARVASRPKVGPFPSIVVGSNKIEANGVFAEAQASYLEPHPDDVQALEEVIEGANMGVVAHYYMDPELQGILSSIRWPHVFIADSLAMGDAAAKMAAQGVSSVAILGVDFMAESVRATLDAQGYEHVPIYRLSPDEIGCSLAASAESLAYQAWLSTAKATSNSLHVVYINTSLHTKAQAHAQVPTITCTSSNVVQTVLQASAQIPDLTIWYGPDTYMGENLRALFQAVESMPDSKIRELHPSHNSSTVKELLSRLQVFPQGNCVVHHMFGDQVVETVKEEYPDALVTAHLEVPGGMFQLANTAALQGRGAVGSTSNILDFIVDKTKAALETAVGRTRLQIVLGTEAGMVTSIVRSVQKLLKGQDKVEVEIVFPVAAEAVSTTGEEVESGLSIVPGVNGGEGCSVSGGCATCPYMKMNSFDRLMDVAHDVADPTTSPKKLEALLPQRRGATHIQGIPTSQLGSKPILHMRDFMRTGQLPPDLVNDIASR